MRNPVRQLAAMALIAVSLHAQEPSPAAPAQPGDNAFRFRSGVELINVTATVTDAAGRFVPGLRREDFVVYEDDEQQEVTQFSADRVPVSLGIVLDTSQSMSGEKIQAARTALDRFLLTLFGPDDEFFLYRFSDDAMLLQDWTGDRVALSRSLSRAIPSGRTALYDAVAEAVPLTQQGHNLKKALVVISDGNDTSSRATMREVKRVIRENEALVSPSGSTAGPKAAATCDSSAGNSRCPSRFHPAVRGGRSSRREGCRRTAVNGCAAARIRSIPRRCAT